MPTPKKEESSGPQKLSLRQRLRAMAARRKAFFARYGKWGLVLWMLYQAVKGTLTTSLIWIPLILRTCGKH